MVYNRYNEGLEEIKPIVQFYLNGFDDLPALREKHLWNEEKYHQIRKDFEDAHGELVEIIDTVLKQIDE